MKVVVNTRQLVAEGVIDADQAREIEVRARQTMIALAVNMLLVFGIISASAGLILYLEQPFDVALLGAVVLALGWGILVLKGDQLAMFGQAAVLIGTALLLGGATIHIAETLSEVATGWAILVEGIPVMGVAGLVLHRGFSGGRFVPATLFLAGVGLHLFGAAWLDNYYMPSGWLHAALLAYMTVVLVLSGLFVDLRVITALALVPFAQMLSASAGYFFATFAFNSPEPTLTILQMGVLIAFCLWLVRRWPGSRAAAHAMTVAVLAFVIANLAGLTGSLYGDVVGQHVWGPGYCLGNAQYRRQDCARIIAEFTARAVTIPAWAFALVWGGILVAVIIRTAQRRQRLLFNTALTFGVIHAYVQFFERFGDAPFAWALVGLSAIPVAWGVRWLNQSFLAHDRSAE